MDKPRLVIDERLSPGELAALAKIKGSGELAPGEFAVDFSVRVRGLLRKGDAAPYQPTCKIPWTRALAFLVQFCGVSEQAALDRLVEAMTAALDAGREADLGVVQAAQDKVSAALAGLPQEVREEPVTLVGDLVVSRINRGGRPKGNVAHPPSGVIG